MYKIVTTLQELPDWSSNSPIFSDIETEDLYTDIRLIQFYQPNTSEDVYILDLAPTGYNIVEYRTLVQELKDYLLDKWTAWYNCSYDLGTLNISPQKFDDLYYAMKIGHPEFGPTGFGLKKVVKKLRYTQGMYDSTEEDHGSKGFPKGSYISASAYRYAAIDVIALAKIWEDPKIRHAVESQVYKVDILSQGYALIYQQNGIQINNDMRIKALKNSESDILTYRALLPYGLNPNSYKQVREHLSIMKSDREALVKHSLSKSPTAKDADSIIRLKRALKEVSYLKSVNFPKVYTKFNVAGAISGRFTSSGGALIDHLNSQQIPRQFQYMFNQPTEDTVILDADYSTLELRLAAALFNEEVMYKQLKEGRDLHTETAIATTGKKLHPDGIIHTDASHRDTTVVSTEYITSNDRTNAKSVNFGFVFGMSAGSFIDYARTSFGLHYTESEAITVRNKYFTQYPTIKRLHAYIWNNYKKPGFYVYTALGRPIKPKLGTDGINTPIQGTGAETTKLAVHYLVKDNPNYPILDWIYNVVHDCIQMRIPTSVNADKVGKALNDAMIKGWTEISKCDAFHFKDIPMEAEVEILELIDGKTHERGINFGNI